jgi:protein-S-isoprenylcysteine O-methyltransferase Ste14
MAAETLTIVLAARLAVPVCATIVLTAVAANFALAAGEGDVKQRKRSPVVTGSMLGFLALVYVFIHHHLGEFNAASRAVAAAMSAVGAVLVIAGCAVNLLGRLNLGGNWANQVTVYEDHTLVRSGVFGIVRHPLYASLIWMFAGAGLVYRNWAALAATALIFVPAMYFRAAQEERLLSRQFPAYREYQNDVGMLVPRPLRRRKRPS